MKNVKYNLQRWKPEQPGERFGGAAHWESCFFYDTFDGAVIDRELFKAKGEKWRIVKITEEELK